jgi:RNA polymerase sigma factor (sigma-70 family)
MGVVKVGALPAASAKRADFEALVHAEARELYRVAIWILREEHEAQDAVQETFERAWRSWSALRDQDRRGAWLRRTCVNRCLTLRRRLFRRRERELTDVAGDLGWLSEAGERAIDLHRALPRLSTRQQAVLTLHYRFGYSLDECADLLGTRPGTVRAHLGRALARLRKELGDA